MATLGPDTPPSSPPLHVRRKSLARRLERCCCTTLSYFPLSFVYGLTTWAVYVVVHVPFYVGPPTILSYITAGLGIALYLLANISYTIAVFTTPGSPLDRRQDWRNRGLMTTQPYAALPTHDHHESNNLESQQYAHSTGTMTSVTAKSSTGQPRYCKKCHSVKPDRSHHCSTCGRCVLKMDHHCPWLATCVGLHNYKPFLLFLTYTSLFCWLCFAVSGGWVWTSFDEATRIGQSNGEAWKVVNAILLAVLGGIIGLVLGGFTAWHIYLAVKGQTTIESLEKTRYLSPLKKSMEAQLHAQSHRNYVGQEEGVPAEQEQSLLEHLKETHANALPGILRPEEGEESRSHSATATPAAVRPTHLRQPSSSPAQNSLQRNYASLEEQRERDRWAAYQDEEDSNKLPNAFDMGWKRNLMHVFGPRPMLWWLPVCNTTGDGWIWEVSPSWTETTAEVARDRAARAREEAMWTREARQRMPDRPAVRQNFKWAPGQGFVNQAGYYPERDHDMDDSDESGTQMQPMDKRKVPPRGPPRDDGNEVDSYDTSSDEEQNGRLHRDKDTANWNDIPDDFLAAGRSSTGNRSRSRGRRKGD